MCVCVWLGGGVASGLGLHAGLSVCRKSSLQPSVALFPLSSPDRKVCCGRWSPSTEGSQTRQVLILSPESSSGQTAASRAKLYQGIFLRTNQNEEAVVLSAAPGSVSTWCCVSMICCCLKPNELPQKTNVVYIKITREM